MSGQAESGTPRPRRVRGLDSAADVRREVAGLYRAARRGEVTPADASKLASVLTLLLRCTETCAFELRLTALEQALSEQGRAR